MPFLTSTNPVVTVSGSDPITSTEGSTPIISIQDATIDQKGAVQLEDSLTSTSVTKAATPKSVKESYEYTTTLSGNLQTDIDGKSDVGHIHDDRYYTESEVDVLMALVSGTDIEDAVTKKHTESHNIASHSDTTATGAQLNTLIGGGNTDLHIHNDHYYTESEVDTISGTLNTEIDGKVSDTAYAASWNGVTETAPSKNAVYDEMQLQSKAILTVQGDISYASAANTLVRLGIVADKKLFGNAGGTAPEWTSGIKIGTFTRDTASITGIQIIAGVGFKPCVIFFIVIIDVSKERSIGLDDGTNHYIGGSVYNIVPGNWKVYTTQSVALIQTAAIYYSGYVTTLNADGFTMAWTKTGAKTGTATILYMAFR